MAARLFRYSEAKSAHFDKKTRTLTAAIATGTPVKRIAPRGQNLVPPGSEIWEVLDQSPENVDLSALNDGAFLDEHSEKDQLGKTTEASVHRDRVSRAKLVFGNHPLAKQRFDQMRSGSRPFLSAGYEWTRIVAKSTAADGRPMYSFAWKGLEVSSVAIPADRQAAVGRADDHKTTQTETVTVMNNQSTFANGEPKDHISEIRIRTGALKRDFPARADDYDNLLTRAHTEGWSLEQWTESAMALFKAKAAQPVNLVEVTDANGARDYSIQRGIQSAIRRADKGATNQKAAIPDGLEGEVHQELIRRANAEPGGLGFSPTGFLVPHDATLCGSRLTRAERDRLTRDSQATIFPAGGAFVPTELRTPVIEVLRNAMVLDRAGFCMTLSGLSGNLVIPREEATATAYSVGEIDQLTASQQILGQISLSPKRVGSKQIYSKQFVMQSTPDAEAFIRNDHFAVIARQWDRLGLVGQGAGDEPLGIFNTPGCQSIIFGGTPTYKQIVAMETALRTVNVTGPLTYVSTPSTKGSLKLIPALLTGSQIISGPENAIWQPRGEDGLMNGCLALDSNQIPGHVIMLGAKNQAVKALWGGLDIVTDIFTRADRAEIVLTINTWGDFAARHPQAFIVSADAGNQ